MPRQTPDQLRAEIVDRAADLFARHGLANTSLQQIADAVQYSKAGLLHYFSSKAAIYEAVLETLRRQIEDLAAAAASVTPGEERDLYLVAAGVDLTYSWPGLAVLGISLAEQDDPTHPDLLRVAELLADLYQVDPTDPGERGVQVLLASSGLTWTAVAAVQLDQKREWRGPIIVSAMQALGHREATPGAWSSVTRKSR